MWFDGHNGTFDPAWRINKCFFAPILLDFPCNYCSSENDVLFVVLFWMNDRLNSLCDLSFILLVAPGDQFYRNS